MRDKDAEIDAVRAEINRKYLELTAVVAALNDLLVGRSKEEPR